MKIRWEMIDVENGPAVRRAQVEGGWLYQVEDDISPIHAAQVRR